MLDRGCGCAEVSERMGVTRGAIYRWRVTWQSGGQAGRKALIGTQAAARIAEALLAGPRAQRYKMDFWHYLRRSFSIIAVYFTHAELWP